MVNNGGFQLKDLSISQVINHVTFSSALIGGKVAKKNPLQDLLPSLNAVISTDERN